VGLFSSDYKPHGSISNTQLMPQRHYKDTFFGELVMQNAKTGESVADNIRYDALEGISAHMRGYLKKGEKYQFKTTLSFKATATLAAKTASISSTLGVPVDSISGEITGVVPPIERAYGALGVSNHLHEIAHTSNGKNCTAKITINGAEQSILKQKPRPLVVPGFQTETLIFIMCDGSEYDTKISIESGPVYIPGIGIKPIDGYFCKAHSGSSVYFFYTNHPSFSGVGKSMSVHVLPIISLQDNWNGERPYETLPWGDIRYVRRQKTLKRLGIEFEELSRGVFAFIPRFNGQEWRQGYGNQWRKTPRLQQKYASEKKYYDFLSKEVGIPPYGSPDWHKDYGKHYHSMMKTCKKSNGRVTADQKKFCADYSTEKGYYNSMVKDKNESAKSIKNVSDAHFGFFATAKTLDESNVAALYYTLAPILKHMNRSEVAVGKKNAAGINIPSMQKKVEPYNMEIKQGSFDVQYSFQEWSMCRRYGIANVIRYPAGLKPPKIGSTWFEVDEVGMKGWDDGPPRDNSFPDTRKPATSLSGGSGGGGGIGAWISFGGSGMIELRIQDKPDASNRPRYLEMRLYKPVANHKIDVIRDGKHGKSGNVVLRGGLKGINGTDPKKPYSDVLMYPISYEAFHKVKVFKRERLMRETMIVRVSAIQMEEVKWYQKGWFKVVMIIIAMVLAYFTGGQSVVAVLKMLAVMAVTQILLSFVDNPILRAIIMVVAMFYGGYLNTGTFAMSPAMFVEAAGIALQTKIAMDMEALQLEIEAWQEKFNKQKKKFDEMQKEVGMDDFNRDFILYLSGLTPVEAPEDWEKRTLNSDLPSIESTLTGTEVDLPAPAKK